MGKIGGQMDEHAKVKAIDTVLSQKEKELVVRSLAMYERKIKKSIEELEKVDSLELQKLQQKKYSVIQKRRNEFKLSRLIRNKLK